MEIVNKQLKIVNKYLKTEKKSATPKTHFGFTNDRSNLLISRSFGHLKLQLLIWVTL